MRVPVVILVALVVTTPALAAQKRPALTGDPVKDIKNAIERTDAGDLVQQGGAGLQAGVGGPFTCDVSLFTKLTFANVVQNVQSCVGDVVADTAKPFADDLKGALDSATAAKDNVAIGCYTPALALVQAAQGTPAVKDATGAVTASAKPPGVITIFQKFREFVNAGGILNCKTTVNTTTSTAIGSATGL
jgi:hypothetical protein